MKLGINAPIELEIRDDIIIDQEESIIAKGSGNLNCGIIKFDINLQQGLSLTDENLDSSIIIKYELKREDLMKENSKPFSGERICVQEFSVWTVSNPTHQGAIQVF
ncbi:hypothetical protein LINPERHAP1_LOCUS2798 [Linum perenne]